MRNIGGYFPDSRGAKGEYPSWHQLEEAGLVSRHNYGTIPPKVDYSLTDDGEALLPTLNELYRWGEAHMRTSQEVYC